MEQWVGILLGFIVVVALIVAYMYRKSNFEVAGLSVTSEAPPAAMATQPASTVSLSPAAMATQPASALVPQPAPTVTTVPPTAPSMPDMVPPTAPSMPDMVPPTAPSMPDMVPPPVTSDMGQAAPSSTGDGVEPAYEAKYAEYNREDDIKMK